MGVCEGKGIRFDFEMVHLKLTPRHCKYLTGNVTRLVCRVSKIYWESSLMNLSTVPTVTTGHLPDTRQKCYWLCQLCSVFYILKVQAFINIFSSLSCSLCVSH
jgi:hypothetical protein